MRVIGWLLLVLGLNGLLSLSVMAEAPADTEAIVSVEQWDMQALPADWWRVLQVKDNVLLKTRFEQLQTKIQLAHATLSTDKQNDTANLSESITTSAKAYMDLVSKTVPNTVRPVGVQEAYTLAEWLDAMRDLRKANDDRNTQAEAVAQISEQLAAIAKDADDAAAAYYAAVSDERVFALLEMVERRLAWFVANESLRLQRANAEGVQALLEQADIHWRLATERLQLSDKDLKGVQQQRDTDRKWLENTTDLLRGAQADAVLMWGDDEVSRAKRSLQQVIALQAAIDEALAKIKNQWDDQLITYLLARTEPSFNWDKDLRAPLSTWQEHADKLDQQRKVWRGQLENRREQVQSVLLALVENPPESLSTKQVSQVKQSYQQAIKRLAEAQSGLKGLHAQLEDTQTLSVLQQKMLLAHDGVWGNRWHNTTQAMWVVGQEFWSLMTATLFKVGDTPVTLLSLIRVMLFLTVAWWLSFWLRKGLTQVASRNNKIAAHTAYTLGRLIHYVIMVVGTIVALSSVGIDFSNLAWIAGALSVGIGFGLQDVVKNFVAGLIVMFEKTLKVGDFIELPSGISGTVKEISLRSTLITTGDNLEVVIPNGEFTSGRVVNWTLSDSYRRVHIPFNVALNSDKKLVVSAVLEAANQVPYTIKEENRAPQVVLGGLDGKMTFELLVWIKQGSVQHTYGVKASYLWQIDNALRQYNIELV
jgi:small-conductance mechanosensitive channel